MGKILILMVLLSNTACVDSLYHYQYAAVSCDKDSCIELLRTNDLNECQDLVTGITYLHAEIRKDKPTKKLACITKRRISVE